MRNRKPLSKLTLYWLILPAALAAIFTDAAVWHAGAVLGIRGVDGYSFTETFVVVVLALSVPLLIFGWLSMFLAPNVGRGIYSRFLVIALRLLCVYLIWMTLAYYGWSIPGTRSFPVHERPAIFVNFAATCILFLMLHHLMVGVVSKPPKATG